MPHNKARILVAVGLSQLTQTQRQSGLGRQWAAGEEGWDTPLTPLLLCVALLWAAAMQSLCTGRNEPQSYWSSLFPASMSLTEFHATSIIMEPQPVLLSATLCFRLASRIIAASAAHTRATICTMLPVKPRRHRAAAIPARLFHTARAHKWRVVVLQTSLVADGKTKLGVSSRATGRGASHLVCTSPPAPLPQQPVGTAPHKKRRCLRAGCNATACGRQSAQRAGRKASRIGR